MNILIWNVRGLNGPNKQQDVLTSCRSWQYGLMGFLEAKIRQNNEKIISDRLFLGWGSFFNNMHSPLGRIWVVWNLKEFEIEILSSSDQFVHCKGVQVNLKIVFLITFIYAHNNLVLRKQL